MALGPRLNPKPHTLNPTPSTLNPKPCTLNPTPSTPNPKPYTLNPTPCTLNPKHTMMVWAGQSSGHFVGLAWHWSHCLENPSRYFSPLQATFQGLLTRQIRHQRIAKW